MPTPQDYPLVNIIWYDAHDVCPGEEWVSPTNLPGDNDNDFLVYSVGYLSGETKTYYEITRDLATETIAPPIRIPKKCIKSIKRIEAKKVKQV